MSDFCNSWTVAHQSPLSMGFSRQEYWSGLPFPSLGDLLEPEIEPTFLASPALAGRLFATSAIWEGQGLRYLPLNKLPGDSGECGSLIISEELALWELK